MLPINKSEVLDPADSITPLLPSSKVEMFPIWEIEELLVASSTIPLDYDLLVRIFPDDVIILLSLVLYRPWLSSPLVVISPVKDILLLSLWFIFIAKYCLNSRIKLYKKHTFMSKYFFNPNLLTSYWIIMSFRNQIPKLSVSEDIAKY